MLFSSGGPSVRFLTRYDGEVSEPLVGRQGSRVSMKKSYRKMKTIWCQEAKFSRPRFLTLQHALESHGRLFKPTSLDPPPHVSDLVDLGMGHPICTFYKFPRNVATSGMGIIF